MTGEEVLKKKNEYETARKDPEVTVWKQAWGAGGGNVTVESLNGSRQSV